MDEAPERHRPQAPGVHRRDMDEDQHGAAARLGAERRKAGRQGSSRPLANHDLRRLPPSRPHRGAVVDRRSDRRRKLSNLCRESAGPDAQAGRCGDHGQPRQPQGRGGSPSHPLSRGEAVLPPQILARSQPDRASLRQVQASLAQSGGANPSRRSSPPSANCSTPTPPKSAPTTSQTPATDKPENIPL